MVYPPARVDARSRSPLGEVLAWDVLLFVSNAKIRDMLGSSAPLLATDVLSR